MVDSNGVEFLVPQLNEGGSSLYKRAVAAANNPTKYCFKVRVSGNLTEGSIEFGRVPGEKFNGAEPVGNFNKPNGGLEQYQIQKDIHILDYYFNLVILSQQIHQIFKY